MPGYSITPRENWKRMLRREKPCWMPLFSDCQLILPNIVPDNVARAFVFEAEPVPEECWGGKDMFGVEWVFVPEVNGSMERPDLPHMIENVSEWRSFIQFPDIDSWDWKGCAKRNQAYLQEDKFRIAWVFTGMFERLISFMGFENAAMALVDDECEDDLDELFKALADNNINLIRHYKQYFDIDGVYFHDDWGSQRAPFFSLNSCRRFLVPHMKRIVDFCHDSGINFELHSCGMNEPLVPAMIECGVDCWCGQPLNDKYKLREQFGDQIIIGSHLQYETPEAIGPAVDEMLEKVRDGIVEKPFYIQDVPISEPLSECVRERSAAMFAALD